MVPATAADYTLNIPDGLKAYIVSPEALATDPLLAAIREHFAAAKRPQGDFDTLFEALGVAQAKGLLSPPIDFKAQREALGENGAARQAEVETFAKSLKARGDIDDGEFGELMSLAPMAAGVRLVEKLRKMGNQPSGVAPPPAAADNPASAAQAEAKAMARDPRYGKDSAFTKAADAAWQKAYA
ncbi:MAG TPA: hypothetical protein VFC47_11310 [Caulobacteraceae bacterium]|nr:hypothetical protein [Caulobacteraceae bacterium]